MRRIHRIAAVTGAAFSLAVAAAESDELLLRKCTVCHTATRWQASRHTWIGWWWIVARMRWINGAKLDLTEQAEIVDRLVTHYPARDATARDEWLIAGFVAFAVIGSLAWPILKRRRRMFRDHSGHEPDA